MAMGGKDACTTCCIMNGGPGNAGKFNDWNPNVIAAGVSSRACTPVAQLMKFYNLQDEVDALISDAKIPPKEYPIDVLFKQPIHMSDLITPPVKTKTQTITEDLKNTVFESYYNKQLGTVKDPVPGLPQGMDTHKTTFGKVTQRQSLYDVIMPRDRIIDVSNFAKIENKKNRAYWSPYDPNLTYGMRYNADKRGSGAKKCLNYCNLADGKINIAVDKQFADYKYHHESFVGEVIGDPSDIVTKTARIKERVDMKEVLSDSPYNAERTHLLDAFGHLNKVRKVLSKLHSKKDFEMYYRALRSEDKDHSGWLPKKVVYDFCLRKRIKFNHAYIEFLLANWSAYEDGKIDYSVFMQAINHDVPISVLPRINDFDRDDLKFTTTYQAMSEPTEIDTRPFAGTPSSRTDCDCPTVPEFYTFGDMMYLPYECTAKLHVNPSNLTHFKVTHRDMYLTRTPEVIRRVFAEAGEEFTDEDFERHMNLAKTYHSKGLVCFETFRRAIRVLRGTCSCGKHMKLKKKKGH